MSMRDYDELENVKIPAEQERIMDIICDAWEECRESDCPCDHGLQSKHSIFACTALKYAKKIHEAGYTQVKWIDVNDSLPAHGKFVLAVTEPGSMSVGRNAVVAEYIHPPMESYGVFVMANVNRCEILNITHWMPIPAPPEVEGCGTQMDESEDEE